MTFLLLLKLKFPDVVGPTAVTGFPTLKVPKRENFSLAFFTLSEPIWLVDLGTAKKFAFYHVIP
jgi:hypothetical protein